LHRPMVLGLCAEYKFLFEGDKVFFLCETHA